MLNVSKIYMNCNYFNVKVLYLSIPIPNMASKLYK